MKPRGTLLRRSGSRSEYGRSRSAGARGAAVSAAHGPELDVPTFACGVHNARFALARLKEEAAPLSAGWHSTTAELARAGVRARERVRGLATGRPIGRPIGRPVMSSAKRKRRTCQSAPPFPRPASPAA